LANLILVPTRYLEAASFPENLPWGPLPQPFLNPDSTLNALVQLGALRLDTDRSFLSFIDRETQWVVSEMTRSHSIREWKCKGDDRVWLGVARLEACWGVCPTTMKAFLDETGAWARHGPNVIANRSRYIVNDFRTDPAYAERPYVQDYPWFVSYLEVPLVSPLGYLLGSYCVVDNKLHDFDNDETIEIMNDIAAAIMVHLDNVRMRQNLRRSEHLLEGLSAFIGSDPSPHPPPSLSDTMPTMTEHRRGSVFAPSSKDDMSSKGSSKGPSSNAPSSIGGPDPVNRKERPPPPPNQVSSSTVLSGGSTKSLFENTRGGSADTPLTSISDQVSENPMDRQSEAGAIMTDLPPTATRPAPESPQTPETHSIAESHANGFISSANIKSAFYRAAATVRQTMDMDGLIFLDAVPTTFVNHADRIALESAEHMSKNEQAGPYCAEIVQSTVSQAPHSPKPLHSRLPEPIMQRFIRRYPRGHVFSADEFGPIDEVYAPGKSWPGLDQFDPDNLQLQQDVTILFQVFPDAKYIIFLPLWHFQRECWYAAALGWVSDVRRSFNQNDLGLMAAFGNSVMAEVCRMETLAASHAKTSFVSSISHELRSPLHGILASSELLREAITDPSLLSTLDMLDSCGKTLLDTFTNLLDHAIAIKDGKSALTSVRTMRIADLGRVVEDVVDAVHFSHLSEHATQSSLRFNGVYSVAVSSGVKGASPQDRPLLVIINISALPTWAMSIDVGAWKRIVMNIYGNALKYTKTGRIEVGLKVVQKADKTSHVCDHICFTVEDTGKGMSSDYLKYRLFTPFSQEDAYAPGIGLGLSIVQQLATGLGGSIDVKSSVGVGTLVEVSIPLTLDGVPVKEGPLSLAAHLEQYHLTGRTLCLLPPDAYATAVKTPITVTKEMRYRSLILDRIIRANAAEFLGMRVIVGTAECPLPPADLYLVDSDIISAVVNNGGPKCLVSTSAPLILLCSGAGRPGCLRHESLKAHGLHLHHPIGPRKMLSFFNSTLNLPTENEQPEAPTRDNSLDSCQTNHSEEVDVLSPMESRPIRPQIRERHTFSVQDIRPKVPERSNSQPNSPPPTSPQTISPQTMSPQPISEAKQLHMPVLEVPADVAPTASINTTPPRPKLRAESNTAKPQDKPDGNNPNPFHLLLVDDNPINIKLLSAVVKKLKHTFETAGNGLEAVKLFEASLTPEGKRFNTVFMDISMPVMDGFEAIREIRKLESDAGIYAGATGPEHVPCKIVALTGLSSEVSRNQAFVSGSDLFLTKPVKMAMVREVLN